MSLVLAGSVNRLFSFPSDMRCPKNPENPTSYQPQESSRKLSRISVALGVSGGQPRRELAEPGVERDIGS